MSISPRPTKRRSEAEDSEDDPKSWRRRGDEARDRKEPRSYTRRNHDDLSDHDDATRHRKSRGDAPNDDSRRRRKRSSDRRDRRHRHRSRSRSRDRSRHLGRRSRSPPAKRRRRSNSVSRSPARKARAPLPSQDESFRGGSGGPTKRLEGTEAPPPEKQKPNYKPTGLLAKEANTVAGTTTVLKYHEPPEARKPPAKEQWRMYVFRKKDLLDTIYLHQRSVWLAGRDPNVTDLLLEHPSITKQHAVIQFRHVTSRNEYGDKTSKVKPYLIDLESANGTKLNGKRIEASRFVELVDGDVVAFGDSEREYVLMLPPAA